MKVIPPPGIGKVSRYCRGGQQEGKAMRSALCLIAVGLLSQAAQDTGMPAGKVAVRYRIE